MQHPKTKNNTVPKDAPLTTDQILALEKMHSFGDKTEAEKAKREIIISGYGTRQPSIDISKNNSAWSLNLPEGFTWGRIASGGTVAKKGKVTGITDKLTSHNIPKNTPLTYRPAILGKDQPLTMRRKNGRLMRLDGIIFNSDDRQVFDPRDDYPWCCVGKILVWKNPDSFFWDPPSGTATATLVGPNMVVTSAHVVPNQEKWKGIFLPGFFDGRTSLNLFSYVETWRRYEPYDTGSDLAILKLYEPIGNQLGWFGTRVYHDKWEDLPVWTKIGYASMIANGNRPNFIGPFPIIDDDDSYGVELEYRADASGGDSGGPVQAAWSDGPYIVGVHSGGEEEFEINWSRIFTVLNNVAAGGPALPDLVKWGLANW